MAGLYPRLGFAARPQEPQEPPRLAGWLLAAEVAAQDQLGGLVTTKADAADGGCAGIKTRG